MPITEIGTIYTPSIYGRTSFPLRHNGDPIFLKTFNSENSSIVITNQNTNIKEPDKSIIYIPNHFFKTGEPLKYAIQPTDQKVGIATTSPGASGITTEFPDIVYPIVLDRDRIRVALSTSYAESNDFVYINSLGIGTQHTFEAFKQNSKCLITINNIIQSPISVGSTVKILDYTQSSITVESLNNIKIGTCLKINDEIVRVSAINYDLRKLNLSRGINVLGTETELFTPSLTGSYVDVLAGNYNIIKDQIYFDEPPLEGKTETYDVLATDIVYDTFSFNVLSDFLKTGAQVLVLWNNPPEELSTQKFYFLIKNSQNNYSLAETFADSVTNTKVQFTNSSANGLPISDLNIIYFYPNEDNAFTGRVFLRSNYDGNLVFDDISEQFTGITSSFELKSSGISTVGIKSDNGILLINNIFQYPGSDEVFSYIESAPSTFVNFVGVGSTGFTGKNYDVNVKKYPRGGIIVSYGTTSGLNYEPLTTYNNVSLSGSAAGIGASVSFDVDEYGNVRNFKFTNRGYNYKIGEVLVPQNTSGIGAQVDDDKIHITVNQTAKDSFNAWNIGILDKLDDLSSKVDGSRKSFSLTKNGQRISLDADPEYEIDFPYNLLVFVNDVLQIPNVSYTFKGGSIITFTEGIPAGSDVRIYFYKGYIDDTFAGSSASKLKEGDILQLAKHIYGEPPVGQKERIIKEFISSDVLRTNVYSDVGISNNSSQLRSVTWTPQKADVILDGTYVSKSRSEQNCGITSISILTSSGISTTLGTFVGFCTNVIGINTTVGVGSLVQVGDYVEGDYVLLGVNIVSIGSSEINIGVGSSGTSTEAGDLFVGITSYSSSPAGINTIPISFYRKS